MIHPDDVIDYIILPKNITEHIKFLKLSDKGDFFNQYPDMLEHIYEDALDYAHRHNLTIIYADKYLNHYIKLNHKKELTLMQQPAKIMTLTEINDRFNIIFIKTEETQHQLTDQGTQTITEPLPCDMIRIEDKERHLDDPIIEDIPKGDLKEIVQRILKRHYNIELLDQSHIEHQLLTLMVVSGQPFRIKYGMDAPYSHAYYIQGHFIKDPYYSKAVSIGSDPSTDQHPIQQLMPKLRQYLIHTHHWTHDDFVGHALDVLPNYLHAQTEEGIDTPNKDHVNHGYERGLTPQAYQALYKGQYGGTYSTMTPGLQNDLASDLIAIHGLVPDIHDEGTNWGRGSRIPQIKSTQRDIRAAIDYLHEWGNLHQLPPNK